jgi:hypothetical protein
MVYIRNAYYCSFRLKDIRVMYVDGVVYRFRSFVIASDTRWSSPIAYTTSDSPPSDNCTCATGRSGTTNRDNSPLHYRYSGHDGMPANNTTVN